MPKFKPNDRVLVKGIPMYVMRHDAYMMPNGNRMGIVHCQYLDANRGWIEFDADESIVKKDEPCT